MSSTPAQAQARREVEPVIAAEHVVAVGRGLLEDLEGEVRPAEFHPAVAASMAMYAEVQ